MHETLNTYETLTEYGPELGYDLGEDPEIEAMMAQLRRSSSMF